jgi:glycosyltransferase involved in cell wall biosynthesis
VHILFLSDNFPPEVNAPASRTFEHCREWVALGAKVTVVTCAPNFPRGRVFNGFKNRLWNSQDVDGIRVIRVWTFIAPNEGIILRTFDYITFMLSSILASFLVRKVDVVVGTSPQIFTVVAAWIVGKLKFVPWVFELRDIWPESIKAVGITKDFKVFQMLERLELFLYRQATCIIAVTNAFKLNLIHRGIDDKKIEVITNGVDLTRFRPLKRDQVLSKSLGLDDSFVVGYIGTHGMAHALETVLEAAKLIQDYDSKKSVAFLFLGDGSRRADLILKARELDLGNVLFLDLVSKEEVPRYWSLLDVAIIHLRKSDLFQSVIPSKLFECMGMGVPVLHGVPGESAQIVLEDHIGEVFESENSRQLYKLILDIKFASNRINFYRRHGVEAAKKYDRKNLATNMLKILHGLVYK